MSKKTKQRAGKETKQPRTKVSTRSVSKNKGGQPTKFKPEYKNQALILAEKGFTDKDIAQVFEVTEQTINNWKKQFPQFFESLKKGKKTADRKVVQSLYQRALGYSHPEVHITNFQGSITKTNVIKHYPPDVTACIYWTKNRMPAEWSDRKEHEISGPGGEPIPLTIVTYAGASKK